jgi:hypothetical protein
MKHISLCVSVILCMAHAEAQVHLGIKAGYSSSNLHFSGGGSGNISRDKPGFNAGIFSTIPLFSSFSLQPEISFSEEGAKARDSSNLVTYNYLNIPVLVKYQHRSGAFFETGPQMGFYLYSNSSLGGMNTNLKSISNATTFSWVFGAGYQIPDFPLGFDIRYNLGISNIETFTLFTTRSNVLQLDLFYIFR